MQARDRISIPDFCLVLLVGASGAGKTTFAQRHFRPTEIVSSDTCRGLVSDDESDQSASAAAFELVRFIADRRLAARRLTVIDATNLGASGRRQFIRLAARHGAPVVAFAFLLDEAACVARNRERGAAGGRDVGPEVVAAHHQSLRKGLPSLRKREGLHALHVFETAAAADAVALIDRAGP